MKLTAEYSASLYSYLPLTSNILHTTLLPQTLNLCSSLDTRQQISHPHKMTGTMSVLQISTCNATFWTEWQQVLPEPILLFFPRSWSFSHFVRI